MKCRIGRGKVGAAKAVFRYGWKQSRGELEPFLRPGEWEPPQWPYQLSRPLVRWSGSSGVKKRATCTKVVNVRNEMVFGDKFREHRRHRLLRPTAAAWTTLPSSCIPRRPYFDLRRGHWLSQYSPSSPLSAAHRWPCQAFQVSRSRSCAGRDRAHSLRVRRPFRSSYPSPSLSPFQRSRSTVGVRRPAKPRTTFGAGS